MAQSDRLISAQKLVIALAKQNRPGRIHYDDLMATIADAPTVNAVEVVHGQWETSDDPEFCSKDFSCSVCEELLCDFDTTALWPGENCYYYCPNCGARMDGRRKRNAK